MSFSKAAEKNFISQPAMSNSIKSLEQDVGCRFFYRDKQKLMMTPEAEKFLIYCKDFLQHYDFISTVMEKKKQENLIVRVGIPPMLNAMLLPEIYRRINTSENNLQILLTERTTQDLRQALDNGAVDIIIVYSQRLSNTSGLTCRNISYVDPCLCAHKKLALPKKDLLEAEDLKGIPLALYPSDSPSNVYYRSLCNMAGFEPRVICESSQIKTLEVLVREGIAAAFINPSFFKNNPDINRYHLRQSGVLGQKRDIALYCKTSSTKLPSINAFLNLFSNMLQIYNNSDCPN